MIGWLLGWIFLDWLAGLAWRATPGQPKPAKPTPHKRGRTGLHDRRRQPAHATGTTATAARADRGTLA